MVGWRWMGNVVGVGASMGIVASLLVAMLGQARYLCVVGRARLVPFWLAKVHPSTGTPINATIFLGICTASVALFTDLEIVIEMISIGTLLVFYLVAGALIYRRYVKLGGSGGISSPLPTLLFLLLLTSTSIGFSLSWKLNGGYWWGLAMFGTAAIAITGIFHRKVPCNRSTAEWSVPLMPWPAAASIFLSVFLMASLKKRSFLRFVLWSCFITLFYALYGVHSTFHAEMEMEREASEGNHGEPSPPQQGKLEVQGP
ncbi:hypothetical protein C4D60_Mb11t00170 [Musa balbisiana]|uniref:Cationic amino acid transporter C-terminal domain-containing protein n=1 Tax=Musa balbisiana TaxID=52838 RepID=A0A4S8J0K0_MUSBA|nr:hypothetical protein C4D60_Mb11t00170 [Musa balbisiana]